MMSAIESSALGEAANPLQVREVGGARLHANDLIC
jgi:hypothetical protein